MAKNLPCNVGDVGSIPGPGTKIPHAKEQLSPTTESRLSRNLLTPQLESHVPQRKIPQKAMKIPHAATKI